MSRWITVKEKDGSKSTALVDVPPFIIIIIGIIAAIVIPNAMSKPIGSYKLCFVLTSIGLVLFVVSKISVFKKGLLLSFGYKAMTPFYRVMYFIGYIVMILGSMGILLLLSLGL